MIRDKDMYKKYQINFVAASAVVCRTCNYVHTFLLSLSEKHSMNFIRVSSLVSAKALH